MNAPPISGVLSGAPPTPSRAPWWAHTLVGFGLLAAGIVLVHLGEQTLGEGIVISAVGFLGVGSGHALAYRGA